MSRYDDPELLGKALCVFLRHQPEQVGLTLNTEGWGDVSKLISGMNNSGRLVNLTQIQRAVDLDANGRFELLDSNIRCVQGHSSRLGIKPPLTSYSYKPCTILYHGTSVDAYQGSILTEGLKPMGRGYVYLSQSPDVALSVASRRKKKGGMILLSMRASEIDSSNWGGLLVTRSGVVLCKYVPPNLISVMDR